MNKVIIGIAADGFSVTVNNRRYWLDQEDGEAEGLQCLFKDLGYEIEIEEEY